MNCHNSKNNGDNKHSHNPLKHMLMMVLCCAAPVILLLVLPLLKINNTAVNGVLSTIVSLICPIMMVAMVPMMLRRNKN